MKNFCYLFVLILCLNSCTPSIDDLNAAIKAKDINEVHRLLEKGAPINSKSEIVQPLDLAIESGNKEIIYKIIQYGAAINSDFPLDNKSLEYLQKSKNLELLKELLNIGLSPDSIGVKSKTLTMWAALNRYDEFVMELISRGADINYADPNSGNTLLHLSIRLLKFDTFKYLISQGADFSIKNNNGQTAYSYSITNKKIDHALFLILKGAKYDDLGYKGNSPWIELAFDWIDDYIEIADLYWAKGMLIPEGSNVLHIACWKGHVEYVYWLLKHGVNPSSIDSEGHEPRFWASLFSRSFDGTAREAEDIAKTNEMIELLFQYENKIRIPEY